MTSRWWRAERTGKRCTMMHIYLTWRAFAIVLNSFVKTIPCGGHRWEAPYNARLCMMTMVIKGDVFPKETNIVFLIKCELTNWNPFVQLLLAQFSCKKPKVQYSDIPMLRITTIETTRTELKERVIKLLWVPEALVVGQNSIHFVKCVISVNINARKIALRKAISVDYPLKVLFLKWPTNVFHIGFGSFLYTCGITRSDNGAVKLLVRIWRQSVGDGPLLQSNTKLV